MKKCILLQHRLRRAASGGGASAAEAGRWCSLAHGPRERCFIRMRGAGKRGAAGCKRAFAPGALPPPSLLSRCFDGSCRFNQRGVGPDARDLGSVADCMSNESPAGLARPFCGISGAFDQRRLTSQGVGAPPQVSGGALPPLRPPTGLRSA